MFSVAHDVEYSIKIFETRKRKNEKNLHYSPLPPPPTKCYQEEINSKEEKELSSDSDVRTIREFKITMINVLQAFVVRWVTSMNRW